MSKQYPGGIISKTAPVPSGPYADSTAPGIWTLEQQAALAKQGNWPTAGNVNLNLFIENLFSTYLYTGTNAAQTITNGIDLSTKGGLVWMKCRSAARSNALCDTVRGRQYYLVSDDTVAQYGPSSASQDLTAFNSNGFSLGENGYVEINNNGDTFVSWTFREQAKFFDIVTYTGNGATNQTISHNLGSTPGCIIVKGVNDVNGWYVYHRGLTTPNNYSLGLSSTAAESNKGSNVWNVTSTTFQANQPSIDSNKNGINYVAYIFAHDAGGFGTSGTDNVISCGSYTGNGATNGPVVTLGYEPQWLLIKKSSGGTIGSGSSDWILLDIMRGIATTSGAVNPVLYPNTIGAENALGTGVFAYVNATGFSLVNGTDLANENGATYIYIAIRRGPMQVPTSASSVFLPQVRTGTGSVTTITTGLNSDSMWFRRIVAGQAAALTFGDKLRGTELYVNTTGTGPEGNYGTTYVRSYLNTGVTIGAGTEINQNYVSDNIGSWYLTRAPGFYDVVCYTGTGSGRTVTHNLGVAPELMFIVSRSTTQSWITYSLPTGNENYGILNSTVAWVSGGSFTWNNTFPTNTVFSLGTSAALNDSGATYVAYLFATLAGVSKVGSYTGTGALLTVNCGFTGGAKFVIIKRTDSTGDWYVYDTARGMTSGDDPYFFTNTTDGAVTNTNYVDTDSTGFKVTAAAPAGLNASGGTYIFLAIA